ncbi:carbohydrate ABC transporter permease [Arthrobacter rhombi]|uniref:carbohydrate ABC transporter permease n=2 Tax=Arthrobacter TaxID=1663 RepID=UPI00264C54D6|nr:carbohydrate ABC transporter permease [Micrococcaceae bacterium]MDN5885612.1 carbohydrate ABC transporter permease [Micrococcaceae bacterium]MDN6168732.1 carbohydrate ABC transporter permease [Micrococcaceae bacterium]MDN6200710.1 carbohydrate ABC transporter permease [Micrococcaceae bacterium]MDN6299187.1 carbohydrate ABC transporter permease [Micrococcaceae bacterium]
MSENLDVAVVTPIRRKRNRAASPAMAGERTFLRGLGITVLWIAVAVMILMLVWMVAQSFRGTREILSDPWGIPASMDFTNYVNAWTVGNFAQATWNSFMTTVVSSVVAVAVAAPAAYYLGRVENKLTNALSLYFILGLGIPAQVILIPLFVMLNKVYLTDSLLGLNLVYIGISMPFTVFLLTAFFRSLPIEMEEAAALDGSNAFGTFFRITLPLAKGGILTAFVLQVIAHWNETLLSLTLMQSTENYTLPVALISFIQQQTYSGADWGGLFAGLVIVVIPMLVVYLWLGRRLTEGLTLGMGK